MRLYLPIALVACATMTASCAGSLLPFRDATSTQATPPRLAIQRQAAEPCEIYVLPTDREPGQADLEIGYATRGAQILGCDGRRQLAVDTHRAEHELEDRWLHQRAVRAQGWVARWFGIGRPRAPTQTGPDGLGSSNSE